MLNIKQVFVSCLFVFAASSAHSETSLQLSGNYVYNDSLDKSVLSFKDEGVVLLRRYKRVASSDGVQYKNIPYVSIWAPYIVHDKNLAKALVCENGNPFGKCIATEFSVSEAGVDWGEQSFSKSELSYANSRFDFGPYSFEKLSEIYKFKFSKIVPTETRATLTAQ